MVLPAGVAEHRAGTLRRLVTRVLRWEDPRPEGMPKYGYREMPTSAADAVEVAGSVLAFKRASSTVFGRLGSLGAAATSGAPHYFFSQTDD